MDWHWAGIRTSGEIIETFCGVLVGGCLGLFGEILGLLRYARAECYRAARIHEIW